MAKLWEERKAPWDETTLLHSAAAEIERLRGPYNPALAMQNVGTDGRTFAEMVKGMKHYLRGETDG